MTIEDLRDVLCDIVEAHFTNAHVTWGRTNKTMPKVPLVCLDFGIQRRSYQPVGIESDEDEETHKLIESTYTLTSIPLIVELFTHGKLCEVDGKTQGTKHKYYKNTALDDINSFVDYMESEEDIDACTEHGIVAINGGQITDTSAVHDNDYEYRARVEFEISFVNTATRNVGIIETAEIEEEEA